MGKRKREEVTEEESAEREEEEQTTTSTVQYTPFQSLKELQEVLNSENVDVLHYGLARFKTQLASTPSLPESATDRNLAIFFEYIESSPECAELFRIWEYQQQNSIQKIEAITVDVIAAVLEHCRSPVARMTGLTVIRKIIQRYLKSIYNSLSSGRVPLCVATFKLLCAIVSHGPLAARELHASFNFGLKANAKLINMRKKVGLPGDKEKTDPRTQYICFALSFLVHGDAQVKRELMAAKDFLSAIFKALWKDSYSLIADVFSTFYDYVIMDSDISRTAKVAFFNNYILEQLLKIYERCDPEIPNDANSIPANLVHHFLISICATPGVGVCFQDAGWYPPQISEDKAPVSTGSHGNKNQRTIRVYNKILSKFILQLKPTEDLRQQELLIKILEACPELVAVYWQGMTLSYDPRLSSKWLANVATMNKIIALPLPTLFYPSNATYPSRSPPIHTVMEALLPTCIHRTLLSKGLLHQSLMVKFVTCGLMMCALRKFGAVVEQWRRVAELLGEKEGNAKRKGGWLESVKDLCAELRRRLPDVQTLIGLHAQLTGHSGAEKKKKKQKTEESETADTQLEEDEKEKQQAHELLHETLLGVLKYYQRFIPDTLSEAKFDVSRLIPSDLATLPPIVLSHLLELLAEAEFRWSAKPSASSYSYLAHILHLLHAYPQPHKYIHNLANLVVVKVLSDSILFQHNASEIPFWIAACSAGVETSDSIRFLDDCMQRCLKTPYRYIDEVTKITQASGYDGAMSPFSPLLMTLLEQFRFTGTPTAARFIARVMRGVAFLHVGNLECLDLCLDRLEVAKIQSNLIAEKGAWDAADIFFALKMWLKRHSNREVDIFPETKNAKSNKAHEKQIVRLLKDGETGLDEVARKELDNIINTLSVTAMSNHFAELSKLTLKHQLILLLVNYISDRHPACGSFLDYSSLHQLEDGQSARVLHHFPLTLLLANLLPKHIPKYRAVIETAANSPKQAPTSQLVSICRQIMSLLANASAESGEFYMELLNVILQRVDQEGAEGIGKELRSVIFEHPAMVEIWIGENDKMIVDQFNQGFANLMKRHLSAELHSPTLWHPFKQKLIRNLLALLDSHDDLHESHFEKLLKLFAQLDIFFEAEDMNMLLTRILKPTSLSSDHHHFLLSIILNRLSQLGMVESLIADESFTALLNLWRTRPSQTLDEILAGLLEGCLPPILLPELKKSMPNKVGMKELKDMGRRLGGRLPRTMPQEIVRWILEGDLTPVRTHMLALLIVGGSKYRQEFVEWAAERSFQESQMHGLAVALYALVVASSTYVAAEKVFRWRQNVLQATKHVIDNLTGFLYRFTLRAVFLGEGIDQKAFAPLLCRLIELEVLKDESVISAVIATTGAKLLTVHAMSVVEATLKASSDSQRDRFVKLVVENALRQLADTTVVYSADNLEWRTTLQMLQGIACSFITDSVPLDRDSLELLLSQILENKIADPLIMHLTRTIMETAYANRAAAAPLEKYLNITLTHPRFEELTAPPKIHQSQTHQTVQHDPIRYSIVRLCHSLVQMSPKILARPEQSNALLEAYSATTSVEDRLILNTLWMKEKHTKGSVLSKMLHWGPGSQKLRLTMSAGVSARTVASALELINPYYMTYSYTRFPVDQPLEAENFTLVEGEIHEHFEKAMPTYDPSFFLPLFAVTLSDPLLLDARKLIECGAIGFIVTALSSTDRNMRRAASILLARYTEMIKEDRVRFREKRHIIVLLDALKNGIVLSENEDEANELGRVPAPVTVFVGHALVILLNPAHFMYAHVNRFLLQRPFIDIEDIPMFYSLFNSSTANFKKERMWILRLLISGLKASEDYKLFKRRHVWDLLTGFNNSQLADAISRKLILELLFYATAIPQLAGELITQSGLFAWLRRQCSSGGHESKLAGLRLAIRALRSCKGGALRYIGEDVWEPQVKGIVSGAIRSIDISRISPDNLHANLAILHDAIALLHYAARTSLQNGNQAGNPNNEPIVCKGSFLDHSLSEDLQSLLKKCESIMQRCAFNPMAKSPELITPSHEDAFSSVHALTKSIEELYPEILIMLFELAVGAGEGESMLGAVKGQVVALYSWSDVDRLRGWVIECLEKS
ncbi:uncharacterized protein VTP21DRAFT_823 [Calcarisporiella thermophila]|uniref:uncharacterized protein n=1 Tax=Calcarisporiella thermophila TaxID=911321 RepID=UPI00374465FF